MTTAFHPLQPVTDPAATYRELREHCPVHRVNDFGAPLFTLSREEDVREMMRDIRSWSSELGQGPWRTREPGIRNDPPEHTVHRRVLNRVLSAHAIEPYADDVRETAADVIGGLPSDRGDLLDDITGVVPLRTFAPFLGMSVDEVRALWRPTFEVLFGGETLGGDELVPWEAQKAKPAWQEAFDRLTPQLDQRRSAPDPARTGRRLDLLTAMVQARDDAGRPLPDDALVHVVMLVLFGAVHTTATMLTNAVLRLLEDRGRWNALRATPSIADAVVEESVRFDPPVAGIFRTTTSDVALHGVHIPGGSKVRGQFAAANRDPGAFDDPDAFRLDRDPVALARRHLGFGFGVHLCAGAPLARLEGRIVLQLLAERLPELRTSMPPTRWWAGRDGISLLQPHGLAPVTW